MGFPVLVVIKFHRAGTVYCSDLMELDDVAVISHEFVERNYRAGGVRYQ
jgi:hypothetical protein